MKTILKGAIVATLFVFFLGFTNTFIHAQPLVPCGNGDTVDGEGFLTGGTFGNECTICHLQVLAMNVLNFFVMISAVVAALLFVNAGVLYIMSSANPGNIAKAHRLFMATLVGAIIIFASWLIINTIMTSLVRPGTTFFGWNNLLCSGSYGRPSSTPAGSTPSTGGGVGTTGPAAGTPSPGTVDEDTVLEALPPNVSIWESSPGATSLDGLQQTTLDGVVTIAETSGLDSSQLIITGGTEGGYHAVGDLSHEAGYKVDFEDTPAFDAYVQSQFTTDGSTRSNGDVIYTGTINGRPVEAVRESTHWDFTFY